MGTEFKPFSLSETLKVNDDLSSKVISKQEAVGGVRLAEIIALLQYMSKNNDHELAEKYLEMASARLEIEKLASEKKVEKEDYFSKYIKDRNSKSLFDTVKDKLFRSKDRSDLSDFYQKYKEAAEYSKWAESEMKKMDHLKFSLNDMKIAADMANKKLISGK